MATKETVEAYLSAWNETDEAKRQQILERCWADSGTYTDPMSDVAGREALAGLIAGFQQQMPGASIALSSAIDEHHGRIRFGWKLDGAPTPMEGIDVGLLAGDGRLESIVGFWGTAPPAA
ncbi:MAG: nuclear transport factor 2 family protein [Dehalococcoidia bacterium]